jgi:DNA-binding winged helix-turn-helix (wHTH) protein
MPAHRHGASEPDVRRVLRFGTFELNAATGELRKHGVRRPLQGKPFQILQALLETPGRVVTREELRQRLWPSDVYVDFESGLNTAANRLRIALGDSAESPRYVETLARTGYRFIAPVEVVDARDAHGAPGPARASRDGRRSIGLAATAVVVVLVASAVIGNSLRAHTPLGYRFRQVTFRRGQISGARFAPDGHSIVYAANWDLGPRQIFQTSGVSPESRLLGFSDRALASVSRSGELALLSIDGTAPITGGALSRVPMNGGAPLAVDRNVMSADWTPSGSLVIVRAVSGVTQVEWPMGVPIYRTSGWISSLRVSPNGDHAAFIQHPLRHEEPGSIKVVDPSRPARSLTEEWASAGGLAWSPSGDEVWFTATHGEGPKSLWAVSLAGRLRPMAQTAGTLTLRDVAGDGRILASRETRLLEMAAIVADEASPRNLSWLDWSRVADVSDDGRLVLFDEAGVAASGRFLVYLHRMDDGSTVRLGEGRAMALAPEGRSALTLDPEQRTRLRLLPLGEGEPVELPETGLEYQWVRYFPEGRRLLALASAPGQPLRLYVLPTGSQPYPITPPGTVRHAAISADGAKVAILSAEGKLVIYPTDRADAVGTTVARPETLAPLLWTSGGWLYVQLLGAYSQMPAQIGRLHVASGRLEPWREVGPVDPLGVNAITKVMLSADARTCVFNYRRVLSELFVGEEVAARPEAPLAQGRHPLPGQ